MLASGLAGGTASAAGGINIGNTATYVGCHSGFGSGGVGMCRPGAGGYHPYGGYYPYGGFGGGFYGYPNFGVTPGWPDWYGGYGIPAQNPPPANPLPSPLAMGVPDPNPPRANMAEFTVQVPHDAEVWIEGVKMSQRGTTRSFVSPVLKPAVSYMYEIRAEWTENGKRVSDSQRITVRAGARASVAFLARKSDAVALKGK